MLADPPIYLPWLIAAGSFCVLAWSLWPQAKDEDEEKEPGASSNRYSQNHSGSGDNNMNF